ncbi:hypothetical protein PV05_04595 [Exophiala xenobiotica]|uniref:non-specific serine/threonine protein kinase n=1 Tax=Exophiala xenobiotica TaxID=348802 RepID=A0A0D2D0I1_9EURO|nr:uncharacterized protein PV05_04595 [Exophiala xenobiotica]KIW55887.1 hypothetical protein PV05_04595 [Exophiala xenobiotica]
MNAMNFITKAHSHGKAIRALGSNGAAVLGVLGLDFTPARDGAQVTASALAALSGPSEVSMGDIRGKTLQEVWPTLSEEGKKSFARRMNAILEQLRSLQGRYIGSVEEGPAVDMRRSTERGGPFSSETDFNTFLRQNAISKIPKIYHRMLASLMSDTHRILFTHGDLSPRNILVREGRIVGLLDWECAGWYPEYWEFVRFFRNIYTRIDWHEYADIIFTDSYPSEVMTDHFLGRLTRH